MATQISHYFSHTDNELVIVIDGEEFIIVKTPKEEKSFFQEQPKIEKINHIEFSQSKMTLTH